MNVARAREVIESALATRVFPAAAVDAGGPSGSAWNEAFGRLTFDEDAAPATPATLFDLASLTKVVATATAAMTLVDRGVLEIDAPVRQWIPEWLGGDRARVSVRDLLEHSSGLPAWQALYMSCGGQQEFVYAICRLDLAYPPRTASLYSDLGFILLGAVLERAGGAPLERLFSDAARPALGDPGELPLLFRPPRELRARCAPTQVDPWRGRLLQGEVDDQNAWALGGAAAHAGLFGTAGSIGAFARAVLRTLGRSRDGANDLARPETMRRFMAPSSVPGSSRALAWDSMRPSSSCGTRMSAEAVGHTGFTGTSLWIDPVSATYVVLLTNRVHPSAADQPIQDVRRAFHDALLDPDPG